MQTEILANMLLSPLKLASSNKDLFYKSNAALIEQDGSYLLSAESTYDFCTYFNMFSLAKWKQYTTLNDFYLQLTIEGSFTLSLFAFDNSGEETEIGNKHYTAFSGTINIAIPDTDACFVGIKIMTRGACKLIKAAYLGGVDNISPNKVKLAIAMTTFNNEQFIVPNIDLFASIFEAQDELARDLSVFIIDNGQNLHSNIIPEHAKDSIRIFPNINAGGAGGFSRGMMEALTSDFKPTHILLMDDDVSISPESFRRTYKLLKFRKKEYRNACINGAMLSMERPSRQIEDVACVRTPGVIGALKEKIDVSYVKNIAYCESSNVELKNAYGAWWYCCMPVPLISHKGLPLPVFVRCDDVEYGIRLGTKYMTLAGICVWHAGFDGRYKGSVDHYQYIRNFLIMNAIHHACPESLFLLRSKQTFWREISCFGYDHAEMILDAFEDYLAGPDFLMKADGSEILKEKAAKNEKLLPRSEIESELGVSIHALYSPRLVAVGCGIPHYGNKLTRITMAWNFDPHRLKDEKLDDAPIVLDYSNLSVLDNHTQRARTIVAYNPENDTASVRHMDRIRYKEIINRKNALVKRYKTENTSVKQAWRKAFPTLTSKSFWQDYLKLNE